MKQSPTQGPVRTRSATSCISSNAFLHALLVRRRVARRVGRHRLALRHRKGATEEPTQWHWGYELPLHNQRPSQAGSGQAATARSVTRIVSASSQTLLSPRQTWA